MKKHYILTLGLGLLTAFLALSLSSCYSDDGWDDGPGPWGNSFYDNRLNGWWELVQADDMLVGRYDTNYLDFLGDGRGYYYYYRNGQPYSERMRYYCQDSGNTSTIYQINLKYGNSAPTTMTYWFTDNNGRVLWLQWLTDSGRTVTYLYRRVGGAPW